MAIAELHLIEIQSALVGLDEPFILENELLLIIELLLRDSVFGPGCAIPFEVHPRLGKDVGISLKVTFGSRYLCLVLPRVDIHQRVALADHLPFTVVDAGKHSGHLVVNRGCVDRGDGTDRIEVNTDVALLCGRRRQRDRPTKAPSAASPRACSRLL